MSDRDIPLRGMNPFDNNRPNLTASERIRNKRDATIYQSQKQRFQQSKSRYGNKNVKYYKNGTIKSMKSYKLQQSLARGNVLCNDCNDKGLLCATVSNKDQLGTIYMGNNNVSEFWGGSSLTILNSSTQKLGSLSVILSDVSGTWDTTSSSNDISKNTMGKPYGYVTNNFKIPRNLDGSGIIIDPSDVLFPNELCDPFRYLQHSYLKTNIKVTAVVPLIGVSGDSFMIPSSCYDSSYNNLIDKFIYFLTPSAVREKSITGKIKALCCKQEISSYFDYDANVVRSGTFGVFDMYIELLSLEFTRLAFYLNEKGKYKPNFGWEWPPNIMTLTETSGVQGPLIFVPFIPSILPINVNIYINMIESISLLQGTIPSYLNQTKYNMTKQSYLSCLENKTRKINFTQQKPLLPIKRSYCSPSPYAGLACPDFFSPITYSITDISGTEAFPVWNSLNDGKYLKFEVSSNTTTTWEFNITNLQIPCDRKLRIDYLVVGGGGSGGTFNLPSGAVLQDAGGTTGGGGGGEVITGSKTIDSSGSISVGITVGAGSPGTTIGSGFTYADRRTKDASNSILTIDGFSIDASGGYNGDFATYPTGLSGPCIFLGATAGGDSADVSGGYIIDPSSSTPVNGGSLGCPPGGGLPPPGYQVYGSGGGAGGGDNSGNTNGNLMSTTGTATMVGCCELLSNGGDGGDGRASTITGNPEHYGGGGGGGCSQGILNEAPVLSAGKGGAGGGGDGAESTWSNLSIRGSPATYYGGGGGGSVYFNPDTSVPGGGGRAGVVILKFYNHSV